MCRLCDIEAYQLLSRIKALLQLTASGCWQHIAEVHYCFNSSCCLCKPRDTCCPGLGTHLRDSLAHPPGTQRLTKRKLSTDWDTKLLQLLRKTASECALLQASGAEAPLCPSQVTACRQRLVLAKDRGVAPLQGWMLLGTLSVASAWGKAAMLQAIAAMASA